jgi:hypothetical protein
VLHEIRDAELVRAIAVDTVAAELGLEPNASLRDIAAASEEPWRAIWLDHREAFTTVASQISEMSQSNRVLLTAGYQAAQATLLSLTEKSPTYGADGSMGSDRRTSIVDWSL